MGTHRIWLFLLAVIFIHQSLIINPKSVQATEQQYAKVQITISASIGEPKLTLFGYSSPNSLVQLQGQRVNEEVVAHSDGYFEFDRILLSFLRPTTALEQENRTVYPELCLTAIDTKSRVSFPTCLPPLPVGSYEITVGPVLLPPTLSLSKGEYLPGEQTKADGLTIPDSEVTIFLANNGPTSASPILRLSSGVYSLLSKVYRFFSPVSPAYAYTLPTYRVQSDASGRFELNLPSIQPKDWRIWAASLFQSSPTPKSNTLAFRVLSWWEWAFIWLLEKVSAFLGLLKPFWWQIIIIMEIIIIGLLFKSRNRSKESRQKHENDMAINKE